MFTVVLGILVLKSYGAAVFLGAPFVAGMISALVANRIAPRSRRQTVWIGLAALAAIGGAIIFFAIEGAVCLVMAFPVAAPIAIMGSLTGQLLAHREQPPSLGHLTLILMAVPLGAGIEAAMPASAARTVLTSVEIDAPASTVWQHVVSFREIQRPPAWYFRFGLAYPLHARIDGTGVGAVRHCEFTTGAFVEPITVWDEPRTLAFDVIRQPPPLREWSPYSRVYAPHLDGFFRTSRGEFRLIALSPSRTRLEGRTWYFLDMRPSIYWNVLADTILHAIHERVLEHVKEEAEWRQEGGGRREEVGDRRQKTEDRKQKRGLPRSNSSAAPQRSARARVGVLAVPQHDHAVHQHVPHADRVPGAAIRRWRGRPPSPDRRRRRRRTCRA